MGVHTEIGAAIGKYVACPIKVKCPPPSLIVYVNPVINRYVWYLWTVWNESEIVSLIFISQ